MRFVFIFLLILISSNVFSMNILEDIEAGIQPYPCHIISSLKKGFQIVGSCLAPTAGLFLSELIAFRVIQETLEDFPAEPLPTSCYVFAAFTSSWIGLVVSPYVYRTLRNEPAQSQEDL